jgi:G:T-mismatch repair DNA endonuclease (very short patch repair protein)
MRDERAQFELSELGWEVAVIWECETRDSGALANKVAGFLTSSSDVSAINLQHLASKEVV